MPKFTWDKWDYDCSDILSYIIRKDICPDPKDIPAFIIREDDQDVSMREIDTGWCCWQVRTDWICGDGSPQGGYIVREGSCRPGKRWFPVWIVRMDE